MKCASDSRDARGRVDPCELAHIRVHKLELFSGCSSSPSLRDELINCVRSIRWCSNMYGKISPGYVGTISTDRVLFEPGRTLVRSMETQLKSSIFSVGPELIMANDILFSSSRFAKGTDHFNLLQ